MGGRGGRGVAVGMGSAVDGGGGDVMGGRVRGEVVVDDRGVFVFVVFVVESFEGGGGEGGLGEVVEGRFFSYELLLVVEEVSFLLGIFLDLVLEEEEEEDLDGCCAASFLFLLSMLTPLGNSFPLEGGCGLIRIVLGAVVLLDDLELGEESFEDSFLGTLSSFLGTLDDDDFCGFLESAAAAAF